MVCTGTAEVKRLPGLLIFWFLTVTQSAWAEFKDYLPNAVAVFISNNQSNITLPNGELLKLSTQARKNADVSLIKAASQISFEKVEIQLEPGFSWKMTHHFDFIYTPLSIQTDAVLFQETDFNFTRLAAGYGPEVSFNDGFGISSINFIPNLLFTHVSWSSPVSGNQLSRMDWALSMAIEYRIQISDRLWANLSIKSIGEDPRTWTQALSISQGFPIEAETVVTSIIGAGLTYLL